jgi:hypothetical protein
VHIESDVASSRSKPVANVRDHRAGPAARVEDDRLGREKPEPIEELGHARGRSLVLAERAGVATKPERRNLAESGRAPRDALERARQAECGRAGRAESGRDHRRAAPYTANRIRIGSQYGIR